jgi:hypothetical protein
MNTLFLAVALTFLTGACGSGSAGPAGPGTGGGSGIVLPPADQKLSDFEDPTAATIVRVGTPARNGYWYSFNDQDSTCVQLPKMSDPYVSSTPPTSAPEGQTSALHAQWSGCDISGAGVGADLNQPLVGDGTRTKHPYDLTGYTGLTFWAMSDANGYKGLRVRLPMTDDTNVTNGGNCDESDPSIGTNKCGDGFGYNFLLPADGSWAQVTVTFSDPQRFKQEGWGHVFNWNPAHVTSIQIKSNEPGETYDFWIDNIYLLK